VSHAGAGTCLEALEAGKPLLVVVNDFLADNHQRELAVKLKEVGYVSVGCCAAVQRLSSRACLPSHYRRSPCLAHLALATSASLPLSSSQSRPVALLYGSAAAVHPLSLGTALHRRAGVQVSRVHHTRPCDRRLPTCRVTEEAQTIQVHREPYGRPLSSALTRR
jgi:hypothetical protein